MYVFLNHILYRVSRICQFQVIKNDRTYGMVPAAQAANAVAQVLQQLRQVRPLGGLHLLVCEFPEIL